MPTPNVSMTIPAHRGRSQSFSLSNAIVAACLVGAVALFGINIAGKALGPSVFDDISEKAAAKPKFGRSAVIENVTDLDRRTGESVADYAHRLNDQINSHMVHLWPTNSGIDYQPSVPLLENYVLFALTALKPAWFEKYEFVNIDSALTRGVGLCSQVSLVASEVLRDNGLKSTIVGLDGHVVATVEDANGASFILDPDYGVVMPLSIQQVEENPDIVRPYYEAQGFAPRTTGVLAKIYGPEGNYVFENGAKDYKGIIYYIEHVAYVMKWALPALLLLVAMILWQVNSVSRRRL